MWNPHVEVRTCVYDSAWDCVRIVNKICLYIIQVAAAKAKLVFRLLVTVILVDNLSHFRFCNFRRPVVVVGTKQQPAEQHGKCVLAIVVSLQNSNEPITSTTHFEMKFVAYGNLILKQQQQRWWWWRWRQRPRRHLKEKHYNNNFSWKSKKKKKYHITFICEWYSHWCQWMSGFLFFFVATMAAAKSQQKTSPTWFSVFHLAPTTKPFLLPSRKLALMVQMFICGYSC